MTRDEAYRLLTEYLTNPNLIKHSLAAEASMRALYRRLNPQNYNPQEEEKWGITGLLHDADYEITEGKPNLHGIVFSERQLSRVPDDILYAIKAHNYKSTKVLPKNPMDWAIVCCDQLTGLVIAAALVSEDKKLASLSLDSLLNRFNDKSFAKGADRNSIKLCEEKLGIPLSEFISIALAAIQSISNQIELPFTN